jgi:hypothetical protein
VSVAQRILVDGEAQRGREAWIDADWLREGRAVAAIAAHGDRILLPGGATLATAGREPEELSIAVLASLAGRAASVARGHGGPVEVRGRGLVAAFVRILLGVEDEAPGRPSVIVDTTGGAAAIADATRRLADLGALVLAAPTEGSISLDLYPDVHLRGLTLAGVPLLEEPGVAPAAAGDVFLRLARGALGAAATEPEGSSLWFHVEAGAEGTAETAVPRGSEGHSPHDG